MKNQVMLVDSYRSKHAEKAIQMKNEFSVSKNDNSKLNNNSTNNDSYDP